MYSIRQPGTPVPGQGINGSAGMTSLTHAQDPEWHNSIISVTPRAKLHDRKYLSCYSALETL
ncbi:hypothetical protein FDG2_2467 [Candidatus Protofrankia californiensis]|uniref:Uncharacterized protein n=1 Tax=Candidatus Protofrankia californiensis TaxID=1839754 RepID=A0A1C3NXP5_9ACTN|nr:hypothetical protein FDG2_2467 [Candidatus Protofrankia californiensis]